MKAYVLAAGYATRLGPLARHRAKPLLQVGGEPVLSHTVRRLQELDGLSELVVITNARFHHQFLGWAADLSAKVPVRVLDDGSTRVEERLGALGDLAFAVSRVPPGDEGWVVVAGDNLVGFDLRPAARAFTAGGRPLLLLRSVQRPDSARRYNEVSVDPRGRVVRVREKPSDPRTGVTAIAVYFFTPAVTAMLEQYLASSTEHDAPGHFISWLVERTPVDGYVFDGPWFDTGSPEALDAAREALREGD
ncbi:MAG: nucleotidyltransferase family protein [Longimicrobiales bacterium]|nr:nucleotidyltransferase family protein [Longimicrobiales bacterium]